MEPTKIVVIQSHQASYASPIEVKLHQKVYLTGRKDIWEGHTWFWAIAENGLEGWIPDDLATKAGEEWIARSDYSAIELDCIEGEYLTCLKNTHGWVWCKNSKGLSGWVPDRNIEIGNTTKLL